MKLQFVEFTITSDSSDTLVAQRKGLIRYDQITAVVDISSGNFVGPARTQITLEEESDYPNDGDETGGVVRGRRRLCVTEEYATVKARLDSACQAAPAD
jgi:hypothetical protein